MAPVEEGIDINAESTYNGAATLTNSTISISHVASRFRVLVIQLNK